MVRRKTPEDVAEAHRAAVDADPALAAMRDELATPIDPELLALREPANRPGPPLPNG